MGEGRKKRKEVFGKQNKPHQVTAQMGKAKSCRVVGRQKMFKDAQISGIMAFMGHSIAICRVREVCRKRSFTTEQSQEFNFRHTGLVAVTHPRGDVVWAAGCTCSTFKRVWARNRNLEGLAKP